MDADQTARTRRLVCTFVVRKPLKAGFLASRPIIHPIKKKRFIIRLELIRLIVVQGALAIRRIFSLVDMIKKPEFSNCPNVLKLDCFGSKICIESIKIGLKRSIIYKAMNICAFYSHPSLYVFRLGAV